jgi:leucyl-tRNA synthetase
MQRNWIGRSTGAEIRFPLDGRSGELAVFTTRPDTLFGVTFVSLAVEHPLVPTLVAGTSAEGQVAAFAARVRATARAERTTGKEGVATGAFCRHPFTGERLPIWVANFVLMEYGTGAVMAVPAHDQRDFEFARTYGLPIRVVIQPEGERLEPATMSAAWEGPGQLVDSGEFSGLDSEGAKERIAAALAARGQGGPTVTYRLRDWGISRQRYWGAPIPVVYCESCGVVPVPEADLPVVLPQDVVLTGTGGSPLATHAGFVRARPTRWTPSSSPRGTSRATARRATTAHPSTARSSTTGSAAMVCSATSAASSTPCCISSMRASSPRCCATWATCRSTSRSATCSRRAWSSRTAPR